MIPLLLGPFRSFNVFLFFFLFNVYKLTLKFGLSTEFINLCTVVNLHYQLR